VVSSSSSSQTATKIHGHAINPGLLRTDEETELASGDAST